LTGVLPGPGSTQTIIAIGYKVGGPVLALLTFFVWALPVIIIMTALSFLSFFFEKANLSLDGLRYIGPMAVGFIVMAAFRIGKKVVKDKITLFLFLFGAGVTYFVRTPWIYPLVLIAGGIFSVIMSKEEDKWNKVKLNPPWKYLATFGLIAIVAEILALAFESSIFQIFENFYRYGYLVIGGGQVVIPMMYSELVEINGYMTSSEFLTGFGLVQGLPGPMFSFSAYAGGMASRGSGVFMQITGALIGSIGIFLPGVLLIYFVYPIWENFKKIKGIRISIKGITAVASGLIAVAAIILMQKSGWAIDNIIVVVITVALLFTKKIPAPLIVLATIGAGFIF